MKSAALFENSSKPEAYHKAEIIAEELMKRGVTVYARDSLAAKLSSEIKNFVKIIPIELFDKYVDVCITIGGDGTVLSAARLLLGADIPIMGINIGRLGFLAEFSVHDIEGAVDALVSGNYRIVDRGYIQANVNDEELYAINDFIIEKKDTARLINIKAYSDEKFIAEYRADGLIVTTPTGSTAYSLSCNGPVIPPNAHVLGITPISPHTLTLRPLILPDTSILNFSVYSPGGKAILFADGRDSVVLESDDKIEIKQSDEKIKMIKPSDVSYFDLIRKKLFWAKNPGEATEEAE
jgi:NAD+ kinase